MENRAFFETICDCIGYENGNMHPTLAGKSYLHAARNCGYDKGVLTKYDENCEYRRIFLSIYYNSVLYDCELDFDGKPLGTIEGRKVTREMERIMAKRPEVKAYITHSMTFASYKELVDEYRLDS